MQYADYDDSDIEATRAFPALGAPSAPPDSGAPSPSHVPHTPPLASVAERLYRFRLDRLILAGGSLAAAAAVAFGFATAGGAAPTRQAPPPVVCVTPTPHR
jgi:hypothetical protein